MTHADTRLPESPFDVSYATATLFAVGAVRALNIEFLTGLFFQAIQYISYAATRSDRRSKLEAYAIFVDDFVSTREKHTGSSTRDDARYIIYVTVQTRFFSRWR